MPKIKIVRNACQQKRYAPGKHVEVRTFTATDKHPYGLVGIFIVKRLTPEVAGKERSFEAIAMREGYDPADVFRVGNNICFAQYRCGPNRSRDVLECLAIALSDENTAPFEETSKMSE